jgi:hypothetical protein
MKIDGRLIVQTDQDSMAISHLSLYIRKTHPNKRLASRKNNKENVTNSEE